MHKARIWPTCMLFIATPAAAGGALAATPDVPGRCTLSRFVSFCCTSTALGRSPGSLLVQAFQRSITPLGQSNGTLVTCVTLCSGSYKLSCGFYGATVVSSVKHDQISSAHLRDLC